MQKQSYAISFNDEKILDSTQLKNFTFKNQPQMFLVESANQKTLLIAHDISSTLWDLDYLQKRPNFFISKVNLLELEKASNSEPKLIDRGLVTIETDLKSVYNLGPYFDTVQLIGL